MQFRKLKTRSFGPFFRFPSCLSFNFAASLICMRFAIIEFAASGKKEGPSSSSPCSLDSS